MDWKEIKADAKDCIRGNRTKFWAFMLLSTLVIGLVGGLFGIIITVFTGIFAKVQLVSTIFTVVIILFGSIVLFGLFGCMMTATMSNLLEVYDGMSIDAGRMFKYTKYVISCAGVMWGFMWRGIVPVLNFVSFPKAYAAFCIKAEKPYMKGHFCWKEAGKVMNGYKLNNFLFILHFAPMLLIGILIFPLGIYWIPYIYQSLVVYYAYVTNMENGGYAAGLELGIDTTPMEESYEDMIPNMNVKEPKPKKEKPVREPKLKRDKPVKEPKPKKEKSAKEPKPKKGLRPAKE